MNWPEANRAFFDSRVWTTLRDRHGQRILKYPTDLYVYEEIIRKTQPDVIVETGSFEGGSAGWFAQFAGVISVDIRSPTVRIPGVVWLEGDSVKMAGEVAQLVGDQTALVTLDSDHNAAHVRAELRAYAPMATEYLIVEDTAVDVYGIDDGVYPKGGPGAAVKTWLAKHKEWQPDPKCDRFLLGMNPGGWLRRVG
jgi:cephalosporin hydroxylase